MSYNDEGGSFARTAAEHFVRRTGATGVLRNLNENHIGPIASRIAPHTQRIINSIRGGSNGSGGSIWTGGNLYTGGSIPSGGIMPFPSNHKRMYHHILNLNPAQFEAYREGASQLLGGHPSPMWSRMAHGSEPLESDAEHYENIIRMPNQHAAAKMIEADASSPTGGGFYKALRHVGRKVTQFYKMGRGALKFVDRNKDVLLDLPGVRDYKEGISSFLDSANAIDEAVNPFVDAAIDAASESASLEQRDKLKRMATQSIDKAIETHLPNAQKYVNVAKDLNNTIQQARRPVTTQPNQS